LQVISFYRGGKEVCLATRAISATWRHELSSSFIFLQSKAPKEIHAILTETLGGTCTILCQRPKMGGPVFPPVMRLVLDDPNSDHPGLY